MPEGDTIFRAARTLNRALAGRIVTRFETQLPQLSRVDIDTPIVGRTVEKVEATGKWMRMYFSGDLVLLTHMLMNGSWHIYRPGEAWQRSRMQMRMAVYTDEFVAVGFQVPIAEFHTTATLARHRSQQLGPDLLKDDFDAAAAAERLRSRPDLEVGVALLRQSLVAGMGNVFKSEVCFASGVDPLRLVNSLTDSEIEKLLSHAQKFLRANVTEAHMGMRRTTGRANPAERLWVYKRGGEPCRKCGEAIRSAKQGEEARVTFWCPRCQPAQASGQAGRVSVL